jgi:leucyl-tRNA synthetase
MRLLVLMLAPAAPHITDELWSRRAVARGEAWSTVHLQRWPTVDPAAVAESTREIPIQVNGKVRDRVVVASNADPTAIERAALASAKVQAILSGRAPERVIQAGGGRLVNIVVRE